MEKLHVENGKLVNEKHEVVQLKGISSHGLSWYPEYVNEDTIRFFKESYGMQLFRLAMYTAEEDGYCVGDDENREKLKQVIRNGVEIATKLEMYVIIDWHILSDGNPLTNMDMAKDFFAQMTAEFKDYDNVIYEICNEPNGSEWADVKKYAEEIIPVIRKNDKEAVILVGTPNWCQFLYEAEKAPVTIDDNLMYVLHFYAATHKEELRQILKDAIAKKMPVFVSEFGICAADGNGDLDYESADAWIELMNENQISYAMWNLANRDESSSFIKADCSKLAFFEPQELNDSAKWYIDAVKRK